jgi:DNA-binding transcriptional LysR family regulator
METKGRNVRRVMLKHRHIEVFHAVYQSGSVSAAARALNVSQPSVSKVLRHAESRIGFTLFRIVKGRLVPTEEAHILFREVRELQTRLDSLQQTTINLRRGSEGRLSLAVLPSLGLDVAPLAVSRFRNRHRDVSIDIQTLHNDDILASLYERQCDLAVSYDIPHHPRLAHIQLATGALVLLFRKADWPDAPERVSLDMVGDRDVIRLSSTGVLATLFNQELEDREGAAAVRAEVSVQTYYVAAALVRRGVGVAVVDEFTARAYLSDEVDFRPLVEPASFGVYAIHLEDRPLSRLQSEFVSTLRETLALISA